MTNDKNPLQDILPEMLGAAWQQPNQSAYDFRSDTVTTPTLQIFRAIALASFNDGWTGGGDTKAFEEYTSQLLGMQSTIFMVSTTLANQVAIWAHIGTAPAGVICDCRSHFLHMEGGSIAMVSGALPQPVTPSNGLYITLEDIKRRIVLVDESKPASETDCPTRVIHLEVPLGGNIMPLEEVKRIKRFATENGVKVNIDGARLWDAVSAAAGSLSDYAAAADSVNLSMSKGIGAPVGSTLSGDSGFVLRAKSIHKSMGGSMRQPGLLAASAREAIESTFQPQQIGKVKNGFSRSHEQARRLAEHWIGLGGSLLVPQETNMVWLDLASIGIREADWIAGAREDGILLHSCRIVTHFPCMQDVYQYRRNGRTATVKSLASPESFQSQSMDNTPGLKSISPVSNGVKTLP
ncbi:threonine aldolase protein [Rutstroemia sp. NJR-2017a BBW]|nr:threonine aldolase protein [Rutstroemia sp. NJR-2017a BBW]